MKIMATRLMPNGPNPLVKNPKHDAFAEQLGKEMMEISAQGEKFTTVDTYAKYLYVMDRKKYERLKFVVSCYFSLEQLVNKKLDNRYLVWLTSILERQVFPENVKIISWNYDFQIQLTASIFRKETLSHSGTVSVQGPPFVEYFPAIGHDIVFEPNHISLLHLNGIAGFYKDAVLNRHVFLESEENDSENYLEHFYKYENHNALYFAWERTEHREKTIQALEAMLKDVTIVVVIGYSFPFFNREMDSEVYRVLSQQAKLRKIYFQDPNRDGKFMRQQLGFSEQIPIEHIKDVDALNIPYEL
jgi:hypothetical protein